jgi:hypothetical protein
VIVEENSHKEDVKIEHWQIGDRYELVIIGNERIWSPLKFIVSGAPIRCLGHTNFTLRRDSTGSCQASQGTLAGTLIDRLSI